MIISGILAAWREVKTIVIGLISLIVVSLLLRQKWLTLLTSGLLGWVFYFFRDPDRSPPNRIPPITSSPPPTGA